MAAAPSARITPDDLRAWMDARGLSAYALAHRIGVSERAVGHWLSGRSPTPLHLRLTLLGVDAESRQTHP